MFYPAQLIGFVGAFDVALVVLFDEFDEFVFELAKLTVELGEASQLGRGTG